MQSVARGLGVWCMQSKINYGVIVATATIILSLFGIIMIYSASSYSAYINYGDTYFYVKKQAFAFVIGVGLMILSANMNLEILRKSATIIYFFSVIILILVLIPGIGVSSYGATRWINLGFITFQPSELSKFGLMIFLSTYLSKNPPYNMKKLIVPILTSILVCVLVMVEPNMSITMCIALSFINLLYVAGMPKKWLIGLFLVGAIMLPMLIILEPYRMKRLMAFLNPWENPKGEGYQLLQSYYALGGGGLFGVGLFNSRQKYLFLPFAESDFIFSIIGEELGLVGVIILLSIFASLIFSGIIIAKRAKNNYHSLLASGLVGIIAIQTLINVAVVTGSIPPTGLPLPYISAGGTSLMVFMFVSGILVNINKRTKIQLNA